MGIRDSLSLTPNYMFKFSLSQQFFVDSARSKYLLRVFFFSYRYYIINNFSRRDIVSKNLNLRISKLHSLAYDIYELKKENLNLFNKFNVLILGHGNPPPDGDCICSANALANLLKDFMPMAEIYIKYWEETNAYIDRVRDYIDDIKKDKPYLESFNIKESGIGDIHFKYVFVVDTDFGRTNFTGSMFDKIGQPEKVFIIDHHGLRECEDDIRPTIFYNTSCVFGNNDFDKSPSTSELILILSIELKRIIDMSNMDSVSYDIPINIKTLIENYKICMGGIQTDTGGFFFEGFQQSLEALSYCLEWIPSNDWKEFQVKQQKLTNLRVFLKDKKTTKIISLLHDSIKDHGNDIGSLVVEKEKLEGNDIRLTPILQEYDFKATIAIILTKLENGNISIRCELRSTDPKLNCREIAKAIDASGGGHIQAAGVCIEVLDELSKETVDNIIEKFRLEMEKYMKN